MGFDNRTIRRFEIRKALATGLPVFPMLTRDTEPLAGLAELVDTEGDSPTTYRWPVAVYRMFMVNSDVASYRQMPISAARHQAVRIALAAERFRFGEGKGDLPENLDALVPDYIPTLPLDPFDGKPMKYRRTDEGHAIIYSIGPDDKDDNGTPLNEADEDNKIGDVPFELKS